jgi:hypothetical protein
MVKTNWATDSNAQQISRLNEHILVADKIRKAGQNAHQGNGLLRNKLLNLSRDDGSGATALSPSLNLGVIALADRSASLPVQNDRAFQSAPSLLATKSSPLKDPQHGSRALANLAALGGSTL